MKTRVHDKEILLIEDNASDAQLALHYFSRSGRIKSVRHMATPEAALEHLRRPGLSGLPALIIYDLDANEPRGLTVVDQIKSDPKLRHIPIVVMTNTENKDAVLKSYQHSANSVVPKPTDMNDYLRELENIEDYWLNASQLP